MPRPSQRPRRFIAPHPLVTLAGVAIVAGMYLVGRATRFQPVYAYVTFGVVFTVVFSAISRRSARREAIRREEELERLRREPIWRLDD